MPVAEAVEIVRGGAGSQFDPLVVEAFLDVLDEIERIRRARAPQSAHPARGVTRVGTAGASAPLPLATV